MPKKVVLFVVMFPVLLLLYLLGLALALGFSILSIFAAPLIVWQLVSTYVEIKK
jgi:hypothetical protein